MVITMRSCSITRKLQIVRGSLADYKALAHYHYRDGRLTAYTALFALRFANETIGVIVYTMPSPGLELRNVATDNLFAGFDRATGLALVNKNVRRISRVIIEPRFRGLGLASRLVRETMPRLNIPIIEAMAVMGLVNPFFERAGMTAYTAKMPTRCVQLIEALSIVGIEEKDLLSPQQVQQKIDKLQRDKADFIEHQIKTFLQSYGKRRNMPACPERTRFVLSKLTGRPVYYIWFNGTLELRTV